MASIRIPCDKSRQIMGTARPTCRMRWWKTSTPIGAPCWDMWIHSSIFWRLKYLGLTMGYVGIHRCIWWQYQPEMGIVTMGIFFRCRIGIQLHLLVLTPVFCRLLQKRMINHGIFHGSQALRNTSRHGPKAAKNHVRSVLKGHLSGYEVESGTGGLKKNHQVLMVFACFCRVAGEFNCCRFVFSCWSPFSGLLFSLQSESIGHLPILVAGYQTLRPACCALFFLLRDWYRFALACYFLSCPVHSPCR